MAKMNTSVDTYLKDGCGRCALGGTPQCKVNNWRRELKELRRIVLSSGLTEAIKWGVPCYTFKKHNVLILAAFKNYCSINFFKGALLKDKKKLLEKPGENTQAGRLIKFTRVEDVLALEPVIKAYIAEAIQIEEAGLKVTSKQAEPIPAELQQKFAELPTLKAAFEALTPGRQRGYILYFSGAKQSATRVTRIEKYQDKILSGKGFHD